LIEVLGMEENRLEHPSKALQRSLRAHIDYPRKQIKQSDHDLDHQVRSSALWDKYELLSSVPGVGQVLSVALPSDLPELGRLERGAVAALAGVAPFNATAACYADSARSKAAENGCAGSCTSPRLLQYGAIPFCGRSINACAQTVNQPR
jgi:transposase